jgi:hypothetical protein
MALVLAARLKKRDRDINNRFAVRRIERVCSAAGYACPVIATPTEMMNIEP